MPYLSEMDPATGFIASDKARETGGELRERYQSARPFPHIVIEDFLPDEIIARCIDEFGACDRDGSRLYDRDQERYKREINPDRMSAAVRGLFYSFNARPFIGILENITGIKGLIPDPYFAGGGFHEIGQGGHLSVHTDFNHHKPMNLERRINVLIYLNRDWSDAFGGQLELWDEAMTRCEVSVVPQANRCVIFNTTTSSNHGNPQPIAHPAGVTRKSIALYYYTATWSDAQRAHTTQFKPRPGSADKTDWAVKRQELINDLMPPILRRALRRKR